MTNRQLCLNLVHDFASFYWHTQQGTVIPKGLICIHLKINVCYALFVFGIWRNIQTTSLWVLFFSNMPSSICLAYYRQCAIKKSNSVTFIITCHYFQSVITFSRHTNRQSRLINRSPSNQTNQSPASLVVLYVWKSERKMWSIVWKSRSDYMEKMEEKGIGEY